MVSAPSGAGKTSLTHAAIEHLAARGGEPPRFSVSYTTREPRSGERDGRDYHFVDEAEFRRRIDAGEFLEHARVFDRYYGTGRDETERLLAAGRDLVMDIDWQGAQQVRAAADGDVVSVFIMPPSLDELARRLRERALDDEATIQRRLAAAEEEMAHAGEYDYVVINDDFDRAREQLERILAGAS